MSRARGLVGRLGALVAVALGLAVGPPGAGAAPTSAFEREDGGPRAAALGGHTVALLDDDYALTQSPGRLAWSFGSASAQYDRIDPDVNLWRGRVGAIRPFGGEVTQPLQTGRLWRAVGGLAVDLTQLDLIEGSSYSEATLTAGAGAALLDFVAAGVGVHYDRATSAVSDIRAHGFGVDVGLAAALADHWDAAMSIRNAFGRVKFDGDERSEDRAAEFTAGVAASHRRWWQAEADYVLQDNRTAATALGVELHAVPGTLDLRGGLARERLPVPRTVVSAGLGVTLQHLHLDYAFRSDPDGFSNDQHQVAIGARF